MNYFCGGLVKFDFSINALLPQLHTDVVFAKRSRK